MVGKKKKSFYFRLLEKGSSDKKFWKSWKTDCFKREFTGLFRFDFILKTKQFGVSIWQSDILAIILLYIFRVSLRLRGSAYRWFSPSPSKVWQVSLVTGRLTNSPTLHLYTGPVLRIIWPVRKENDFASIVPERESNSSYTAQVDPSPSDLSTRPTLLLTSKALDLSLNSLTCRWLDCCYLFSGHPVNVRGHGQTTPWVLSVSRCWE